jgi:ribosome-binding protein aMBF1 (putative translation factor)
MSKQLGIEEAIKAAGSQSKLGASLEVTQQAINRWARQGWVPLLRAEQIEKRFGVPRARLVNPKILAVFTTKETT